MFKCHQLEHHQHTLGDMVICSHQSTNMAQSITIILHNCYHANDKHYACTDSKVHWANMGLTWVLSAPGWPHVSPMNLAIRWWSLEQGMLSPLLALCEGNPSVTAWYISWHAWLNSMHQWWVAFINWILFVCVRADSRFVPSSWEMALLCNNISHLLGARLKSALYIHTMKVSSVLFIQPN